MRVSVAASALALIASGVVAPNDAGAQTQPPPPRPVPVTVRVLVRTTESVGRVPTTEWRPAHGAMVTLVDSASTLPFCVVRHDDPPARAACDLPAAGRFGVRVRYDGTERSCTAMFTAPRSGGMTVSVRFDARERSLVCRANEGGVGG